MLSKLRPVNENPEKRTFFQAYKCGKVYNPNFEYADNKYCSLVRSAFEDVFYTDCYADLAQAILEETMRLYGTAASYKSMVWGDLVAPDDALARAEAYARMYNIQTNIDFGKSLVTTMGKNSLNLVKKPGYYRDVRLDSLLDHELSVHHIRSKNHKLLNSEFKCTVTESRKEWVNERLCSARRRVCSGLRRLLEQHVITMDEEGLASVVTHALYDQCYLLFQPALSNYIVHLAKRCSFHECFKTIMERHYATDMEDAWTQVMRAKRSQQNTSQPGGFCKDILPFVGAIRLLQNLERVNLPHLFVGKIRLDEYWRDEEGIKSYFHEGSCQVPHFLHSDMEEEYMAKLYRMKVENLSSLHDVKENCNVSK